ncbi:hypothetical protein FSP39_002794 [Pinctada imbricata]|uniref:Peptidyl-prolyl cis-trans isomerase n=1 Tax=Pinctada imbricata TaxID=66713 RepID=A0AA89BSB8_PINIB|nr:hypothetical protein FSP39_002794 [Pinctada imbricata]
MYKCNLVLFSFAENFRVLCTGQKGYSYKDSVFHRIVPNILCQGGDITNKNGTGGKSIYGKTFKDENFKLKHNARGVVSMANSGPNTNGSQFFICCGRVDEFDGKHVVVGKITDGFDVLTEIEQEGSSSGRVGNVITITNCGQLS